MMDRESAVNAIVDIALKCISAGPSDPDLEEWEHCRRVEKSCALIAEELDWDQEDIADLQTAALLHHVDRSDILECAPSAEGASIIALADTFDTLTSHQRYRRPLSHENAIAILRHDANSDFDKTAVDALCRVHLAETSRELRKKAA